MKRKALICCKMVFDPKAENGQYFNHKCKYILLDSFDKTLENSKLICRLMNEKVNGVEILPPYNFQKWRSIDEFEEEKVPKGCPFKLEHKLAQGIVKLNV